MDKLFIWSPMLFGAVIGWIVVYFMRHLKEHSHEALKTIASIFISGVGLTSLTFIVDLDMGVEIILFYLLGIVIGFFLHWLYQLVVSFFFKAKFSDALDQYLLFSSCSLTLSNRDRISKIGNKSDKINSGFQLMKNNLITEEEFLNIYRANIITAEEYEILESEGLTILDVEVLTFIEVEKSRNRI